MFTFTSVTECIGVYCDDRARPDLLGIRHCGSELVSSDGLNCRVSWLAWKIHDLVLPEARAENEGVVPASAVVVLAIEDVVSRSTG